MSFLKIAWLLGGVFDGSHKGTESFGVGWGVLVLKRIKIKKEGKGSKKKKKEVYLTSPKSCCPQSHFML